MACANVDMDIHGADAAPRRADWSVESKIQCYQATETVPANKVPLHDLLQKGPAELGSVQLVSGLLSFGMGIIFATTQEIQQSLFTLFRVSHLTGLLFIIAGVVSNMLFKYPGLLAVSLWLNCGCIIVAVAAICLISVDLAHWSSENQSHLKMELLELCVLLLEVTLSAMLCVWFFKEKKSKSP